VSEANQRQVGIIDDDDAVRNSLRFLLEVVGYPVAAFASAAEFLEAGPTNMACLVLDHHMPNMTGLELADRLRRDGVGIPILLITGSPSPDMVARAAELGIDRVLEKPPNEQELLDFIGAAWS
jgi:FixJ family two-component response regulator